MSTQVTVEDCVRFMDAINTGRVARGVEPIETLEYDECEPSNPYNCLSARHLFYDARVGSETVTQLDDDIRDALVTALGTSVDEEGQLVIPKSITTVTDVFDESARPADGEEVDIARWRALRDSFVEAGFVE